MEAPQRRQFSFGELGLVLPNLKELTLSNAGLSRLGDESLHNLKKLDISGLEEFACESPDVVIPMLKQMPFLEELTLAIRDGFGSSAVQLNDLFELPSLTSLYLMCLCCFSFYFGSHHHLTFYMLVLMITDAAITCESPLKTEKLRTLRLEKCSLSLDAATVLAGFFSSPSSCVNKFVSYRNDWDTSVWNVLIPAFARSNITSLFCLLIIHSAFFIFKVFQSSLEVPRSQVDVGSDAAA